MRLTSNSLRVVLLGGFSAYVRAASISLPTRKTEAFLAYLALTHGEAQQRDALARFFWGAQGLEHARNNLRQALTALRRALGPDGEAALDTGRSTVALGAGMLSTDIEAFERLATSDVPAEMRRALELYRGEFMSGFESVHAPAFQEWRTATALRLRDLAVTAAGKLLERTDDEAERVLVALRLVELDPSQEAAHRALMRHHAAQGLYQQGLEQYEACRDVLRDWLGRSPAAETEKVRAQLVASQQGSMGRPVAGARPSDVVGERGQAPGYLTRSAAPEMPSLAVLPFANMSGDPEQDYFADGMVEELITALSRIHWLFVIARNSAFTYKGRTMDVRDVGRELGVRYIMEGSVRKAGHRVRITAQLLEAETRVHVWTDRFDGDLSDIFGLQDRIAEAVVCAVAPSLRVVEIQRARRKPTESLDAYDLYLRALPHHHAMTHEGYEQALRLLRRALSLDEGFAFAAALCGLVLGYGSGQGWCDPGADHEEVLRLVRQAISSDPGDPEVLAIGGRLTAYASDAHNEALRLAERALGLGARSALALSQCGWAHAYVGRPREAIALFERAYLLDPVDPMAYSSLAAKAVAHLQLREDELAIAAAARAVQQNPNFSTAWRVLAAAQALAGREDEAAATTRTVLTRVEPGFTLSAFSRRVRFAAAARARYVEGMRKAGLPD